VNDTEPACGIEFWASHSVLKNHPSSKFNVFFGSIYLRKKTKVGIFDFDASTEETLKLTVLIFMLPQKRP